MLSAQHNSGSLQLDKAEVTQAVETIFQAASKDDLLAAAKLTARHNSGYASHRDLHLCSTISNRALMGSPEDYGVLFTACDFPLADVPAGDLWNLARRSKETLSLAQSKDGAKAVLGAVSGIVQSGLDAYAAGEAGIPNGTHAYPLL